MAIIDNNSGGGLWAGFDNRQIGGDDLSNQTVFKNRRIGQQVLNYRSTANYNDKALNELLDKLRQETPQQTNQSFPVTTIANGFDFATFLSDNKWLVLGALAIGGYFFFSGGLTASDRTVTSVTRFSPKASK